MTKPIFWNTNTQMDYFEGGSIKINNSESIRPKLRALTEFSKEKKIKVINVIGWNESKSKWFSETPDFVDTFPPHCVIDTPGTNFISETLVDSDYFLIKWDVPYIVFPEMHKHRNIIIFKNHMNMIQGNKFSDSILNNLGTILGYRPDYIVYGVNAFSVAKDLRVRGYDVKVVTDASININDSDVNYEEIGIEPVTSEYVLSMEFE